MSQQPLVSVIVPIYNVEAFLPQALASLAGQTYPNIEVLMINDASTDSSAVLARAQARTDSRFYYSEFTVNSGLSAARNYGLAKAGGEYICFVDSDDTVQPDFIEGLLAPFQRQMTVDFTAAFAFRLTEGGYEFYPDINRNYIKTPDDIIRFHDLVPVLDSFTAYSWLFMFKTAFLRDNKLTFPVGLHYEDEYFFWHAAAVSTNGYYHCRRLLYNYRLGRFNSITSRKNTHADRLDVWLLNMQFLAEKNRLDEQVMQQISKKLHNDIILIISALNTITEPDLRKKSLLRLKECFCRLPSPSGADKITVVMHWLAVKQPLCFMPILKVCVFIKRVRRFAKKIRYKP
jgi:glycosyltransferase involved in cell wall biosynthesis